MLKDQNQKKTRTLPFPDVKVGSWSTVKPPPGGPITVLFSAKITGSSFRGACEKVLLEGHPNRTPWFL